MILSNWLCLAPLASFVFYVVARAVKGGGSTHRFAARVAGWAALTTAIVSAVAYAEFVALTATGFGASSGGLSSQLNPLGLIALVASALVVFDLISNDLDGNPRQHGN